MRGSDILSAYASARAVGCVVVTLGMVGAGCAESAEGAHEAARLSLDYSMPASHIAYQSLLFQLSLCDALHA